MALKSWIFIICAVMAVLFSNSSASLALEAKAMDVDEITKSADFILSGKITDTTAKW